MTSRGPFRPKTFYDFYDLSLAALRISLSRDWIMDPENKILRGKQLQGTKQTQLFQLSFLSYSVSIQRIGNAEISPHLGFCLLRARMVSYWKAIIKRHIYCVANQNLLLSPPH